MTFEDKLYARRDDEMDDYGDGSYGENLEDEEYEEEEEEEEEPESVSVVEEEVEVGAGSRHRIAEAPGSARSPQERSQETGCEEGC